MRGKLLLVGWLAAVAVTTGLAITVPGVAGASAGFWNVGHEIQCTHTSVEGGFVDCAGYFKDGKLLTFQLRPTGPVRVRRTIGNEDEGTHPLPPAHWSTIVPGLQCRRGPGSILVQCRNAHHGFVLRRHRHTVT